MYKIKYIIVINILGIALNGCNNYLNIDESVGKSKELAYGYFNELTNNVTHLYGQLQNDWGVMGNALREAATDNAVYTWSKSSVYDIYSDSWSPINTIDNVWGHYYSAIRSANIFLENYTLESFERFKYNDVYEDEIDKARRFPFEARFLRAWYFFELAKRYGDIPLLTRSYSTDEINNVEKTSFNNVIDFIISECDAVVTQLPVSYRNVPLQETGRATQGVVLAFKSRVLLYSASPLHNPSEDSSKWELAVKAAWKLISSAEDEGWYSLVPGENLFSNGNNVLNAQELIFERRNGDSNSFEQLNLPIGFEGGNSGNTPTQNLVDAFEMNDGTPFDWNNPMHAANPYLNRDPRFYKTIAYNGSELMVNSAMRNVIETFRGGKNGPPLNGATLTGYYLRKYIDESVSLIPTAPISRPHHYILFRYAEILLNYAEAMNEWKGPDYKDASYTLSSREALNKIRAYSGMPNINDDNEQGAFRIRIRNERRIELAFEDHRFWDIRRWKMGEVVNTIYGIEITSDNNTYQYSRKKIQDRVWDNKMYLYPIPDSERFVNDNLTQNPGW